MWADPTPKGLRFPYLAFRVHLPVFGSVVDKYPMHLPMTGTLRASQVPDVSLHILGDNPVDFFREKILILHSLWLTHQLTTQVGLGTGISRMVKKIIDLTDLNQSTTDYKCGEIGQSTNLKDIMGYQDDACATTG